MGMPSLGDDIRKVKWRAKQVLDYAFLMMYAHQRSSAYYLQLEDDVLVKDYQFVTTMQNVARNFSSSHPNWFLINFAEVLLPQRAMFRRSRRRRVTSVRSESLLRSSADGGNTYNTT